MQSENCGEIHEQILNEPLRSQTQLATQAHMEQTVNIENYKNAVNVLNKCSDRKNWRWLERHVGGGQETMIHFVVA